MSLNLQKKNNYQYFYLHDNYIYKMVKKNILAIPSFVSHAHILLPIMHHCLSGDSNKKVALSTSLSPQKHFIVPIEEFDTGCISLENFLVMLDTRISAEYIYREEVMHLKNKICDEFNALCEGVTDEEFIKFVRNQRQKIVNALFDETRIQNKMVSEKFFNNMMNGFEEEALDLINFDEIVYTVSRKPLLTPFPIRLENEMKKLLGKLGVEKSKAKIEELALKLIDHIKKHLKVKHIKDINFNSKEELKSELEALTQERRICKIELKKFYENRYIVREYMEKCVEKLKIRVELNVFLNKDVDINYDEIDLEGRIEAKNIENLFKKIQEKIELLCICFGKLGVEDCKKMSKYLSKLKNIETLNLNLGWNGMKEEGIGTVATALSELKNISTLNLNLSANNIGEKGAQTLLTALSQLKNILILDLDFGGNGIGMEGTKALSIALRSLKNISILNLNLSWNDINEEGIIELSVALKELKHIKILNIDLESNDIGKKGAKSLSIALSELKNISSLILNLTNNKIQDEEAIIVTSALKDLTNILILNLDLRFNAIREQGKAYFRELELTHPNFKIHIQQEKIQIYLIECQIQY